VWLHSSKQDLASLYNYSQTVEQCNMRTLRKSRYRLTRKTEFSTKGTRTKQKGGRGCMATPQEGNDELHRHSRDRGGQGFTPNMGNVPRTVPPRGLRHPRRRLHGSRRSGLSPKKSFAPLLYLRRPLPRARTTTHRAIKVEAPLALGSPVCHSSPAT
jgi:hypothetical protein